MIESVEDIKVDFTPSMVDRNPLEQMDHSEPQERINRIPRRIVNGNGNG